MTKVEAEILETARSRPWLTHRDISEEVGTARSWVSDILERNPGVDRLRDAYRTSVDVSADPEILSAIASALEQDGVDGAIESFDANRDDITGVEIAVKVDAAEADDD